MIFVEIHGSFLCYSYLIIRKEGIYVHLAVNVICSLCERDMLAFGKRDIFSQSEKVICSLGERGKIFAVSGAKRRE